MANELEKTEKQENMLVFGSKNGFEQAMRMAKCLSASTIVPKDYQGDKGLPNCIIALEMANRMKFPVMMVMQNLYVVYGNVGWSSKFLIASVNTCGKFKTPLRYEYKGKEGTDEWGCRACATDIEGNVLKGSWVTLGMAKKEGWYSKNGSKWQTMPELMMQYRAGAFFQRAYAPEISMGLMSAEELHDMGKYNRDIVDVEAEEITTDNVDLVDTETGEIVNKKDEKANAQQKQEETDF